MKDEQVHQCSKEIEVIVLRRGDGYEMRLRVNGSIVFDAAPFAVEHENEIRDLNESLDGYASDPDRFDKYHEIERELGHLLGNTLFAPRGARGHSLLGTALGRVLCGIGEDEYVRLCLSFENPAWSTLPWELSLWSHPETGTDSCLGLDGRMTLSRIDPGQSEIRPRRAIGTDGLLSILNVGAHTGRAGEEQYELTRAFLQRMSEYIQGFHTVSRAASDLWQYWGETAEITGRYPEIDIVHWHGHGSSTGVIAAMRSNAPVRIDARELLRRTEGAFLYVLLTCESAGKYGRDELEIFSSNLLAAGAPAVLAVNDTVRPDEFPELPLLYPMLFQGLPLDYCAQYLRRFFARSNKETSMLHRVRWHKLMLRAKSTWYLDSPPNQATGLHDGMALVSMPAMIHHFAALRTAQQKSAGSKRESARAHVEPDRQPGGNGAGGALVNEPDPAMAKAGQAPIRGAPLGSIRHSAGPLLTEAAAVNAEHDRTNVESRTTEDPRPTPENATPPRESHPPPRSPDEAAMLRRHYDAILLD